MTDTYQSSPHASHCSCRYEVARLQKENDRQRVIVEAVREYRGMVLATNGIGVPWTSLDDLMDSLNALDKATE